MGRSFLVSLLPLAATACATTAADLRRNPPAATFQTTHTRDEVVRCLTDYIDSAGQPNVIATANETTLSFVNVSATTLVWAIGADGTVRVWRLNGLYPYQRAAERCL